MVKATEVAPDVLSLLRSAGLRVTGPRAAVLGVLLAHPHSTAEVVATRVRRAAGSVSTQAVYDVLRACTGAGIVRRIEPAGSAARYETRAGDNHHHLVCRSCGAIVDVDCAVGAAPCLTPSNERGFTIDEAEVVFWGQCTPCQNSPTTTGTTAIPTTTRTTTPKTTAPRTTTTEVQA